MSSSETNSRHVKANVARLIRFGLVGLLNTAVYYIVYRLLLWFLPYLAAHIAAFCVGIIISFFANCTFTYHVKPTWRRFIAFPATTLINLFITTFGSAALVRWAGVSPKYATLVATAVAVPFTYIATTFVLAGRTQVERPGEPHQSAGS